MLTSTRDLIKGREIIDHIIVYSALEITVDGRLYLVCGIHLDQALFDVKTNAGDYDVTIHSYGVEGDYFGEKKKERSL
jgi:hypothetical protein